MPVLSFALDDAASRRWRAEVDGAADRFWERVGHREVDAAADRGAVDSALRGYCAGLRVGLVDRPGGDGDHARPELRPRPAAYVETDGERALRPRVDALLARRPSSARLTLLGRRPPLAVAAAAAQAGVDPRRVRARVGFTRGHLVQVVLTAPEFGALGLDEAGERAETLALDLLGEALFDDWVEAVHGAPGPRGTLMAADPRAPTTLPLAELLPAVAAARDGVLDGLPGEPHARRAGPAPWTLLTLEPSADRGTRQRDRLSAATWVPELLRSYLAGAPFSSCRFSRHGERFASVSWPRRASLEAAVAERDRAAALADAALAPAELGCVVGHGVGLERLYLDLCLGAPEAALAALLAAWRGAGAPADAELAFLDDDLVGERLALGAEALLAGEREVP